MRTIEHHPPDTLEIPNDNHLIFLAGPIQGARDWQAEASGLLTNHSRPSTDTLHIANPRRYDIEPDKRMDEKSKLEQIKWEKARLARAGRVGPGAVLFWLEAQDTEIPYPQGRSYAQTTRQEFGRAMGWLDYDPNVVVAIGMHPAYVGNEYYYRDSANEFGLWVHSDLSSTCQNALDRLGLNALQSQEEAQNG